MSRENIPAANTEVEPDRQVKAADEAGCLGTTARYWINQHLPVLARTHLSQSRSILDLGCGDGPNAALLASAGLMGRYLGVDAAQSPYWSARAGSLQGLSVRFTTHDAHDVDALTEDFDALVSVSAFEHFRDDRRVVAALGRRLVRGARGIVMVPSPLGNLVWGFHHGFRTYTPDRFRALLSGSSFRLLEAIPSGSLPSLLASTAWRGSSLAAGYAVLGALWLRHGGDREAVKRGSPWATRLAETIQFGHLGTRRGRELHQAINRQLLSLDERLPGFPTQWAFIIERI